MAESSHEFRGAAENSVNTFQELMSRCMDVDREMESISFLQKDVTNVHSLLGSLEKRIGAELKKSSNP
jgi:hypothetical protein